MSMSTDPDISVIVPTRNRAAHVAETLAHLAAQSGDGLRYEVLVVDNSSMDATRHEVERAQVTFPAPLRYIYERRRGKPWALNTGMAKARGQVFAFLDDDVRVGPDWLASLRRCLDEERADAVAGRVIPQWPSPPAWLTPEFERHLNQLGLGCIDHGPERRRTADGHYCRWVGSNLAIRRDAAARIGGFQVGLARGEDTEYYHRCRRNGLRIVYEPSAIGRHLVGAERLTARALRQWRRRQGWVEAALLPWKPIHLVTVMPAWRLAKSVRHLTAWFGAAVRRRGRWDRFYHGMKLQEEVGAWTYRLAHWPAWWAASLAGRRSLQTHRTSDHG
jgi:glycosyltransferase involved in cell wall biosynthesis